jgi:uncharacterized protein
MKQETFPVTGMHCPACERLVAEALIDGGLARSAAASRARRAVTVEREDDDPAWLEKAGAVLAPMGYEILAPGAKAPGSLRETLAGLGLAAAVLAGFAALQASGIVSVLTPGSLDVTGAFVLGVVASLSSCFALVGGLLVTYTSALASSDPGAARAGQGLFHLSRLVAFVLLGGALGALGGAVALDLGWTRVLQGAAALVMVGLGLRLVGAFAPLRGWPAASGGPLPEPAAGGVAGRVRRWAGSLRAPRSLRSARVSTGALLGVVSFFLPCGFTQSMQFQALASGSAASGAALMGAFAAGTLPVLAGLSTALVRGFRGAANALLARAAGFLVLGLGLYQVVAVLVGLGVLHR